MGKRTDVNTNMRHQVFWLPPGDDPDAKGFMFIGYHDGPHPLGEWSPMLHSFIVEGGERPVVDFPA